MSLVAKAFGSMTPLFILLGVEFCAVCAYMGYKGELFGVSVIGKPSTRNNYILPFLTSALHYLLTCAVPLVFASSTAELGPQLFARILVYRLLTNGGIIYIALGELGGTHYIDLTSGMAAYGISLGLAAIGLALFLMNCDKNFDRSLFWRPMSGKQNVRDRWKDENIWSKDALTKNDDIWIWAGRLHPTYIPFDTLTPWICERLVEDYKDKSVERPKWIAGKISEDKFIKRMAQIYEWHGNDAETEEVNEALEKLFGRSGRDLMGVDGQLTFIKIKSPKSKKTSRSVGKESGGAAKVAPAMD